MGLPSPRHIISSKVGALGTPFPGEGHGIPEAPLLRASVAGEGAVQWGRQGQEQQEAEGWEGGVFGGKATRNPGRGSSGAHSCAGRCGVNAGPL